jgi:hypothetical protein
VVTLQATRAEQIRGTLVTDKRVLMKGKRRMEKYIIG